MSKLRCYNRGCGQHFDPNENETNSCTFHPGNPIFHDAKKKWSCCNKYSTDFGEFMNIKGCTVGPHNPEKPKPEPTLNPAPVVNIPAPVPMPKPMENQPKQRPPTSGPLHTLEPVVSSSLKTALESLKEKSVTSTDDQSDGDSKKCHNKGCKAVYVGPESNAEICMYHPGAPVFHEGCKYWSCCKIKTTEFESFLAQPGCTSGRHKWEKDDAASTNQVAALCNCRFDWFQIHDTVTVNVYAKNVLPESCKIACNEVYLEMEFLFAAGSSKFSRVFNLYGIVDPKASTVNLMATKVEVVLKKAEACSWAALEVPSKAAEATGGDKDKMEED